MKILAPLASLEPGAIEARYRAGARELYFGLASAAWTRRFGPYCNINRMSDFGSRANTIDEKQAADATRSIHAAQCSAFVTLNAGLYEAEQLTYLRKLCQTLAEGKACAGTADGMTGGAQGDTQRENARMTNVAGDGANRKDAAATSEASAIKAERSNGDAAVSHARRGANAPDGVIVSTRTLGRIVAEAGLSPVASTMLDACNADVVRTLRDAGFKRIIVPREMSLDEIGMITAAFPDMEFEAFLMRDGCMFSDSHCFTRHLPGHGALCGTLRMSERRFVRAKDAQGFADVHNSELTDELYRSFHMKRACGLCAIYRLLHMGIAAVKIVGRADNEQELLDDIALVQRNLDIAQAAPSEQAYLNALEFPPDRAATCKLGLNCYYPEVRFPL